MNILVRGVPDRQHKALSVIAAVHGIRSTNDVLLAVINATVEAEMANPVTAAAFAHSLEGAGLASRVKVDA